MVRATAISVAPSAVVKVFRSAAHARDGAMSASGLPAARMPVMTPVLVFRKSRRSTVFPTAHPPRSLGKIACGPFADNAFVSGGKRRDFCRLLNAPVDSTNSWDGEWAPQAVADSVDIEG